MSKVHAKLEARFICGKKVPLGTEMACFAIADGGATLSYAEPAHPWLGGIRDHDDFPVWNWILSGVKFAID
jgi:hypothetical protein